MASAVTLVLGVGLAAHAEAAAPADPAPVRILLLGDSITHGSAGDWTWRYRLAEQLTAQGVRFDLVGPSTDLFPSSMDYIDPDFDGEHAALWGMAAAAPAFDVSEIVARYQPDVVIEMLGVNDLTWLRHTPQTVVSRVETMTEEIRSVDPDIDVLLSEVPALWLPGAEEFNDRLSVFAAGTDTPGSRAVLLDADRDYVKDLHTYDSVHPSSLGEQALAFAALDALRDIGIGSGSPAIAPDLPLGPRLVPTLSGWADEDSASLVWSHNRGADRQFVWWRDVTVGSAFVRFDEAVEGTATTVNGLTPSHRYAFVLQPAKGVHVAAADVRSNEVEVGVAALVGPQPPPPDEPIPAPIVSPAPPIVATETDMATPHLESAPNSKRPRLRATKLPGSRVRLRWRDVSTPGPVEIQVRLSGAWLTWRKVSGAKDALVTRGLAHRARTKLRLRDSSGATSEAVVVRMS